MAIDKEAIKEHIRGILIALGDDPDREGLRETPDRVARMYEEEPFHIMSMDEYCDLIVECIDMIPENIIVHRLTGDGPRKLLIAPMWSTDKKKVLNTLNKLIRA